MSGIVINQTNLRIQNDLFLTEDDKTSSSGIFIRNKQNPELDSKKIGELVEEDINKDGTSIYITSNKIKVPFKEEIKKEKKGFKDYPNSKDLSGDQLFVNSDRIILSAKAKEFIIFGKGNTGVITDGNGGTVLYRIVVPAGSSAIYMSLPEDGILFKKNKIITILLETIT